jgi:hypothetical protein
MAFNDAYHTFLNFKCFSVFTQTAALPTGLALKNAQYTLHRIYGLANSLSFFDHVLHYTAVMEHVHRLGDRVLHFFNTSSSTSELNSSHQPCSTTPRQSSLMSRIKDKAY